MMDENSGLMNLSVSKMVTMLSAAYVSLVESKTPFHAFPSVMLWGAPGVGKSQGVRAIAAELREKTGRKVVVTDVRLLLFNPVDLRGIPTASEDRTLAVWLKPKIFQMDGSEGVINILFLDEISAAPQSVQAAAYQITLDRAVGEHKLPENCIVIAAGNRVTDRSVAYHMPKALANRLCHFNISADSEAWHDWAVGSGVHPYVVGYLEYNPTALMKFDPAGTGLAFPTPRTWEMTSNILNTISDDMTAAYPLIVGCIGFDAAASLKTWAEIYADMPPVETICGGDAPVPKDQALRIALRSQLLRYVREHPGQELVDRSIDFACKLPWEFRGKLMRDYYHTPCLRPLVKNNAVFQTAEKKGYR